MFPLFRKLGPGETPTSGEWNALVEYLSSPRGHVSGVVGGEISLGFARDQVQVFDHRENTRWIKVTSRAAGNNYAWNSVYANGDGTFTSLPSDADNAWGTTSDFPAHESNGRVDFDSALPIYVRAWPDPTEATPGMLFEFTSPGAAASDSSWKIPVRAATTANGTLSTAYENGDTIDGVVLATGDRILVKNQSSANDNGIYVVAASGSPTRATDADTGAKLLGATVFVSEGTSNKNTVWSLKTNAPITVGFTNQDWSIESAKLYSTTFAFNVTADNTWTASGSSLTLPPGTYLVGIQAQIDGIFYDNTTPGPLIVNATDIQVGYGIGAAPAGNAIRTVCSPNIAGANNTDQKGQIRRTFTVVWPLVFSVTTTIEVYGFRATPTAPAAWTNIAFGNGTQAGGFFAVPYTDNN